MTHLAVPTGHFYSLQWHCHSLTIGVEILSHRVIFEIFSMYTWDHSNGLTRQKTLLHTHLQTYLLPSKHLPFLPSNLCWTTLPLRNTTELLHLRHVIRVMSKHTWRTIENDRLKMIQSLKARTHFRCTWYKNDRRNSGERQEKEEREERKEREEREEREERAERSWKIVEHHGTSWIIMELRIENWMQIDAGW